MMRKINFEGKNMKNKKGIKVLLHTLFWAVISYYFLTNSLVRPFAVNALYKEILSVVFIMIMIYFNYLYLIPTFFQTGRLGKYWSFAILTILAAGVSEFLLVKSDISQCYARTLNHNEVNEFLASVMIMIIVRDFCFFLFFFLLRLYQDLSYSYLTEKEAIAKNKNIIFIAQANDQMRKIEISDIAYISQFGNKMFFHFINGKIDGLYYSLKRIEKILPDGVSLRLNRNTLVMISKILEFDSDYVVMNLYVNGSPVKLQMSSKYKENILSQLESNLSSLKKENGMINGSIGMTNMMKKEGGEDEKEGIIEGFLSNPTKEKMLSYISQHPGCQISDIMNHVDKSHRTVARYLSELKMKNLIEHRGANKNGGYFVVVQKSKE